LEDGYGIAENVRTIYDGLTLDRGNLVFSSDGSAEDTTALFARTYGELLLGVAPAACTASRTMRRWTGPSRKLAW
jgi:hypothetical protein